METIRLTEAEEAAAQLRDWVKPGDTIYTVLRHVSASGMSRNIDFYKFVTVDKSGRIDKLNLTYNIGLLGIGRLEQYNAGLFLGGGGMDMGFHAVYSLSRILYRDAFTCIGKKCPSNDHTNGMRRPTRATKYKHSDAGYAINHEWI